MEITGNMIISDVLNLDREAAAVFFDNGLHCLGCPSAAGETIEEACAVHGIDSDKLIKELNEYFSSKD